MRFMILSALLVGIVLSVSSCATEQQGRVMLPENEDEAAWQLLHQIVAPGTATIPDQPEGDVSIPEEWELRFHIFSGDYLSIVTEEWTLTRTATSAELERRRWRNYDPETKWGRTKYERWKAVTPQQADIFLKTVSYAIMQLTIELPSSSSYLESGRKEDAIWFYYPFGFAELVNGEGRKLWSYSGYDFTLSNAHALWTDSEDRSGMTFTAIRITGMDAVDLCEEYAAARVYLLLTQRFPDGKNWRLIKTVDDSRPVKKSE